MSGIHPVGTRALLVDLPDLDTVMAWHGALSAAPLPGQTGVVAAARTVLLQFSASAHARTAVEALRGFRPAAAEASTPKEVTVDVVYDGEDLADLADTLGMSSQALIDWHTSTTWVAAFGGFAPGFTYCAPHNSAQDASGALTVPRRDSPRTAIPAGAVGLAGGFSAVYPRTSPGGWQLIGTTAERFWDADAEPPALLAPGDVVRYRAVRDLAEVSRPAESGAHSDAPARPVLRLDDAGLQTLVEDLGRPGFGDLGVSASGAADRASAIAANDAVGNRRGAGVLENIGGLTLTALVDTVVAVTGAQAPVRVGTRAVASGVPLLVPSGSRLSVGAATGGLRSYVGVRGGVAGRSVLGSVSTDVMSGLGPAPLQDGDSVRAGEARGVVGASCVEVHAPDTGPVVLRVVAGPRDDWFTDGVDALTGRTWQVSGASNRIGVRLTGEPVQRAQTGEIPSEGMLPGCVQVPPDGNPVVFLRDHAVTGGYPVIATVVPEDLDLAAQLAPGTEIAFQTFQEML
ncbi:carboxyltransferase domain-containing protein [Corynebacterium sp. AOP40-9SA-29]|uniref:carboxyltransferase domain-containing protein n=1 Tax=Corynebacterium sp. AOP40-9SA-29 TaxID=3457677 RepID=UPI0040341788